MVIYKTTNLVNGKIYVGQSIHDNETYLGSGTYIKIAIRKYGRENFKREIIERCKSKEELNDRELFWIKNLNSIDRTVGYNVSLTPDGIYSETSRNRQKSFLGRKHTDETKNKIRNALTGKKKTESHIKKIKDRSYDKSFMKTDEYRKKMSNSVSGEKNGMYGKHHSSSTRKKISERAKGRCPWNKGIEKPNYFKTSLITAIQTVLRSYHLSKNDFISNADDFIKLAKKDGLIRKNLGISLKTINDYGVIAEIK